MTLYVTHAGKMSVNAHGLFWAIGKKKSYKKKWKKSISVEFEVFTKIRGEKVILSENIQLKILLFV